MASSLRLCALLASAALASAGLGCRARLTAAELTDPAITARVRAALDGYPELDIRYLDIYTHMRIVTISGMVDSRESKQKIADLARHVLGVSQVEVNLAIQE